MPDEYETHDYDVIVVGAGGAGLRAAIEASAQGVKTALICKSLLGKAHTVMAEGGIAAALGNVDPEDTWQVHFRDTMRGGKMLNNWRMAHLHAQEAPERVLELERWGALFDRTKDGRILQRDFGGHRYARLAHVGDRTGLEMIRTLQQHAVHRGIDVFMECIIARLLKDGERIAGAFGYWRESGRFVLFRARARAQRVRVEGPPHYNPGWHLAWDLRSLLTVSEAVTLAALERKESRGGHTRDDYPRPDPQLANVNVVVRQRDGKLTVTQEALPEMPDELKKLFGDK